MFKNFFSFFLLTWFIAPVSLFAHDPAPTDSAPLDPVACPVCDPCPVCQKECPVCEKEEEKKKKSWDISLLFGFNYNSGNTDTNLLDLGARADREVNRHIFHLRAAHRFGENDNETNVDDSTARGEYKYLYTERAYVGQALTYTRDEISDVDYRVLLEPKAGYFFVKNDEFRFNVEAGPGYIFEDVGGITDDYLSPFIGERMNWKISETAKLFQEARFYFSAESSENYLINFLGGLETKIVDSVSLITGLEVDYDNEPAEDLKKDDVRFVSSLSISLT